MGTKAWHQGGYYRNCYFIVILWHVQFHIYKSIWVLRLNLLLCSFTMSANKTGMWNMIYPSSPATPIWEFSQHLWHYRCRHHLKNNCIWDNLQCFLYYYSAAKFTFPIEQTPGPIKPPAKCGIRRSWKLKVKLNLGCCSNIASTISYISVFVSSW